MQLLYTLDQAAEKLGFSRKTLQRKINLGLFRRPLKIASSSLVSGGDIETYLQMLENQKEEKARKEAARRAKWLAEMEANPWGPFARPVVPETVARTFRPGDPNRLP